MREIGIVNIEVFASRQFLSLKNIIVQINTSSYDNYTRW